MAIIATAGVGHMIADIDERTKSNFEGAIWMVRERRALDYHAERLAGVEDNIRRPDFDIDRDGIVADELLLPRMGQTGPLRPR